MSFLLTWIQLAWFAIEPMEWLTIGLLFFAGIQVWLQATTERTRLKERTAARDEEIDRAFHYAWAEHFRVEGFAERLARGDLIEMAYLDILHPSDVLPSDSARFVDALGAMSREAGFLGGVAVSLGFDVKHSIALLSQSVKAFARQAPPDLSEPQKVEWLRKTFGPDLEPLEASIRKLVPEISRLMWDAAIQNPRATLVRSLNFSDDLTSEFGKAAVKSLMKRSQDPSAGPTPADPKPPEAT